MRSLAALCDGIFHPPWLNSPLVLTTVNVIFLEMDEPADARTDIFCFAAALRKS